MRVGLAAFTIAALTSATAAAAADDDISAFEAKPTAVYLVFGLGTPAGWLGAEVERTLEPNWTISAGGGWGLSGPQGSAMTHLLLGESRRSRFAVGAGISGGRYTRKEWCIDGDAAPEKTGSVAWGNLEVGGEHRFFSGFAVRYFGGYGHVIAGDLVCEAPATSTSCGSLSKEAGRDIIYTGVAVGGAF